jgi:quercetin dioxygenase-like cupin family protein
MRQARLDAMWRGWFVGDFSPGVLKTAAAEVAVKRYAAGEREGRHYHAVATEVTCVVSGRVRMSGVELGPGDIVALDPGEATEFEALTDAVTVVVKTPSVAGDKYDLPTEAPAPSP